MATLAKAMQVSKGVNNVTKLLTNLSLSQNVASTSSPTFVRRVPRFHCALIHTTPKRNELMEFFDEEKNWGKKKIQVGRSWQLDELRHKSNEDLHKLWFVLLKERNMLLTMEEAYKVEWEYFPNPERIDKVEDSMANLETVVRERNEAYHMLETGKTGEQPVEFKYNQLGIRSLYRHHQYHIPKFMNTTWHEKHKFSYGGYAVRKFLRLFREKLANEKRKARNLQTRRVGSMMQIFPNLDLEAVKEQYPDADIEKLKRSKKANRGHFVRH